MLSRLYAKNAGDMNRLRRMAVFAAIGVVVVIAALVSLLTARSDSEVQKNVEGNFEVGLYSISYSETASPQNDGLRGDQQQNIPKTLLISCQVEVLDPKFVLGMSPSPVIEESVDDEGRDIEVLPLPGSSHRLYSPPRFHPLMVVPPQPGKWTNAFRSVLRLSVKRGSTRHRISKLQPSMMHIGLSVGMNGRPERRIRRIKGYFHVLVAESFEYVDVRFQKSDTWVRLTPDVEVQVRDASCSDLLYRLSTEAGWRGGARMRPLSPDTQIADRLVVGRQLVGSGNRPAHRHSGGYCLPYHVGGRLSGGSTRQITKIRYLIAVNPRHYEIPFVLENISVPKP